MSGHWRLAVRGAAWVATLAVPTGAAVFYVYGAAYAGALLYGIGLGILSLLSTALTVSLLAGRSRTSAMIIGAASFLGRYGLAAVALGIPAYLDLWPVVAMLGGFVAVYLVENVVLLPGALRMVGEQGARRKAGRSVGERAERRAEA